MNTIAIATSNNQHEKKEVNVDNIHVDQTERPTGKEIIMSDSESKMARDTAMAFMNSIFVEDYIMDHAFSSAKVTVEVVRHAVTVRLNSCESQ